MKRSVLTVKQYDYSSIEEFERHKKEMKTKGYHLTTTGNFGDAFDHGIINGSEKWVYTACYFKDTM